MDISIWPKGRFPLPTPVYTARVHGRSVSTTRVDGPSWRVSKNPNVDIWPFNPKPYHLQDIPRAFPIHQVWTLWDHSFLSYAADKQTNKQTDKQTDWKILKWKCWATVIATTVHKLVLHVVAPYHCRSVSNLYVSILVITALHHRDTRCHTASFHWASEVRDSDGRFSGKENYSIIFDSVQSPPCCLMTLTELICNLTMVASPVAAQYCTLYLVCLEILLNNYYVYMLFFANLIFIFNLSFVINYFC